MNLLLSSLRALVPVAHLDSELLLRVKDRLDDVSSHVWVYRIVEFVGLDVEEASLDLYLVFVLLVDVARQVLLVEVSDPLREDVLEVLVFTGGKLSVDLFVLHFESSVLRWSAYWLVLNLHLHVLSVLLVCCRLE